MLMFCKDDTHKITLVSAPLNYATCGYDHLKGGFGRVPRFCSGVSFESHGGVSLQWIHLDCLTLVESLVQLPFQIAIFQCLQRSFLCGVHERS